MKSQHLPIQRGRYGAVPCFTWLILLGSLFIQSHQGVAQFNVTNNNNDGAGSLRAAIAAGNATGTDYTISLQTAGPISLTSVLPDITQSCTITGVTSLTPATTTGGTVIERSTAPGVPDFRLFKAITPDKELTLTDIVLQNGVGNEGENKQGGGGVLTDNGVALMMVRCVVRNCLIPQNRHGGGVQVVEGRGTFIDCEFQNNGAPINIPDTRGGAVNIGDNSSGNPDDVTFLRCTFVGNSAERGGGVFSAGAVNFTNCTFDANTGYGGDIYGYTGNADVIGCTFRNNPDVNLFSFFSPYRIINSLFIGATFGGGNTTSLGGNVTNYNGGYVFDQSSDKNNQVIVLGELQQNSGGLVRTFALGACSPAVNAGISSTTQSGITLPTTDANNQPRVGLPDAGSYEFQSPAISGLAAFYCKDAAAVTLMGTPSGGGFTIDNQAATQLDPASLSAGNHTVRYTVTENSCTVFTEQSVEIKPLPNASFTGLAGPYCADAASITLNPATPGGTFSGPGVAGTTFTPANAGSGGTITYTVTVDGCTSTSSQNVTVNPLPNASFAGLAGPYCANASPVTLLPTTPGGTFSGPGMSGNTFAPANAGSGGTITYTVTVDGCTSTSSQNVTVKPLPNTSFSGLASSYCADAAAITLTPTTPGGTFSGPGVADNTFTPANAGSGGTITYTVTVDGCTSTSSQNVTVRPPINLTTSPNTSVVYGYGSSCTTLTASATGGTGTLRLAWSNGATGNSTQVCPTQTTTYTVTATDAAGCSATKIITVTVNDVRCGYGGVKMCQGGRETCVAQYLVPTYLRFGYTLGGCNSSTPARIGYEQAQEVPLSLSLKAYPNPTQDALTVEVLAPVAGMATFELLDVAGRARQVRQQELTEGHNEVEFRLGSLPAGIYLIRAVDAMNRQGVLRISKQ
ncbi:choice-of-anchor Q domain-containing protein [Salmonirosea aquatica]|uniref:T9SS type A sorting domain-containing protein n=1 Tax=Salmonirosea aquatica TaxID=2654236 RepID=A0A7C9BBT2_9BACT|nr:T9SS type A sorting domain-containing protein [Cytophagaceae bacterium SJW1-29]